PFVALGICNGPVATVDSFNPLKQNGPFRQGVRQHYGVSASGGNEITTFYVSGDFQREKGIFRSNDLKKTSLRANLRNQVSRLMDIGITTAYVSSDLALPQNDNNSFGILPSGLLGSADSTSNGGYGFLTPQQAEKVEAGQRIERFTGGLNINFRPWSFLTVRGTAGYDVTNQSDRFLTPPNEIPFDLDGTAFRYGAQIRAYTANLATTASFRPSPVITSNTTVGLQFSKNVFEQVRASGRKIVTGTSGVGGVVFPSVGDSVAPQVTLGGYVEEQVGIRDRLYFTGALRADKNSAFGTDFGNIIYPKLSGSWVISEEPFFPRMGWLSSLRLRAAWGRAGRAPGTLDAQRFSVPVAVAADGSDRPNVSWSLTVSAWGNKNRVLATDTSNTPIIFGLGGATQRHQKGYPAGGYWGTPYSFRDVNGDGLIDPFTDITPGDTDTFQGSS